MQLLLVLGLLIAAAELARVGVSKLGQPAVLGELVAGVLLGPTPLNLLGLPFVTDSHLGETVLHLAELGVVLLMFQGGLEVDLEQLRRVGRVAAASGTLGVVAPLLFGAAAALLFAHGLGTALFIEVMPTSTASPVAAAPPPAAPTSTTPRPTSATSPPSTARTRGAPSPRPACASPRPGRGRLQHHLGDEHGLAPRGRPRGAVHRLGQVHREPSGVMGKLRSDAKAQPASYGFVGHSTTPVMSGGPRGTTFYCGYLVYARGSWPTAGRRKRAPGLLGAPAVFTLRY